MWYGQSEQNVKQLFEKARKQQPAVIFIDEVDSLLGKRSGGAGGGGGGGMGDSTPDKRVTNEFLSFIVSWFARRIYVPLPDRRSRADLIKKGMVGVTTDISDDGYLTLADKMNKYSGRDLVQVCREASMRPLRELWGQRLLESGSEQKQVEQRLVNVVADFLIRGKPATRLRKELEGWRRRHKSVSHSLTVDGIMEQAERVVAVRLQAKAAQQTCGGGAGEGGGGRGGAGVAPVKDTGSGVGGAGDGCVSGAGVGTGAGGEASKGKKLDAVTKEALKRDQASLKAALKQEEAERKEAAKKLKMAPKEAAKLLKALQKAGGATASSGVASATNHPQGVAEDDSIATSSSSAGQCKDAGDSSSQLFSLPGAGSGIKAGVGAAGAAVESSAPGATSSIGGVDGGSDLNSNSEAQEPGQSTETKPRQSSSGTASDAVGTKPRQSSSGTASDAVGTKPHQSSSGTASDTVGTKPHQSSSGTASDAVGAKPRQSASDVAGSKQSKSLTWTIEELLALPADTLRPVKAADFESALKQMMPCDVLGSRYEEWNQQYGSGADSKSAVQPAHMMMYM
eukprot:gene12643-15878_t